MNPNEKSTNPQINKDSSEGDFDSKQEKIDHVAGDMARKAGKVEKKFENSDTVGGVRSNSGGIFSK
jgi:hypothetical protein